MEVYVIRVFVEKALKAHMHVLSAEFVITGGGVAGDASRVLFAFPGVKTRADQLKVGDGR